MHSDSRYTVKTAFDRAALAVMVEEATVDAYGEDEQAMGFHNLIEESLEMPFATKVLGQDVVVKNIELGGDSRLFAICKRGTHSQKIALSDLPMPTPPPRGAEWIAAYRYWLGPS